jgi:hypothetical protein
MSMLKMAYNENIFTDRPHIYRPTSYLIDQILAGHSIGSIGNALECLSYAIACQMHVCRV